MGSMVPGFASEIRVAADVDSVGVTGGNTKTIGDTGISGMGPGPFYFVSNRSSAAAGQSFLKALALAAGAAGGATWTIQLSADFKVTLAHDSGSAQVLHLDPLLAQYLGFDAADGWAAGTFPGTGGASIKKSIGNGVTVTATYKPRWWWSPDTVIHSAGPKAFNPYRQIGVPSSAGAAQWSPGQAAAYTKNGVQYKATLGFMGVETEQKVYPVAGYLNEDFIGFWAVGPSEGRKVLFWRNREDATLQSGLPAAGSASPYKYVQYQPDEAFRADPYYASIVQPRTDLWEVQLSFWVTPDGEAVLGS